MATQPQLQPEPQPHWTPITRIAFRLCFLYFTLYCLTNQILTGLIPIPGVEIPDLGSLPPVRPIVVWIAVHVFHAATPLVLTDTGSGDRVIDWVLVFLLLTVSVLGAILWSALDRGRPHYIALDRWFRLFLRFALGSTMVSYGLIKLFPMQMPFPTLTTLVEPFGNFSPMHVLWSSIGSSPAYESFTGSVEFLGGVLLFIPRTATFGAIVCLAAASEVFVLNITYDVNVKLLSFHLILLSLVLLAPNLTRIARFFFSIGAPQIRRRTLIAQLAFGVVLIFGTFFSARAEFRKYGLDAPAPPLYGIWNVDRPADHGNIRRVIIDRYNSVAFQSTDDTFSFYRATTDAAAGTIALTRGSANGTLQFRRTAPDHLTLDGTLDSRILHLELQLQDRNQFLLINRGFHWIQDRAFNR